LCWLPRRHEWLRHGAHCIPLRCPINVAPNISFWRILAGLTSLLIGMAILVAASGEWRRVSTEETARAAAESSVLSVKVGNFEIQGGTMEAALRTLREIDYAKILIGFEKVARHEGEKERTFSLSASDTTVEQIIQSLCAHDPRYTYEVLKGSLLHIFPVNQDGDPPGLLSIRVARFSIEGKITPAAIVDRISDLVPELNLYMERKQAKYYARQGIAPGSPGAILSGNMDPQVDLNLEDVTVEEILNAVVLYSLEMNRQAKPNSTGYKLPPTSWIYEFIIDPAARTGFGGTPHWEAF